MTCDLSCDLYFSPAEIPNMFPNPRGQSKLKSTVKSKSRLPVTIKFRGDAYRRLFRNKGQIRDGYHFLEKADFPPKFFPQFWDYCADSHGQGIKVFYPVKIRHFISWSPKKYRVEDHNPSSRAFQEKLTFSFIKVALGDTS